MNTNYFIKQSKQIMNDFYSSVNFSVDAWKNGLCTEQELRKSLNSINETFDEQIEDLEKFGAVDDNMYQANVWN